MVFIVCITILINCKSEVRVCSRCVYINVARRPNCISWIACIDNNHIISYRIGAVKIYSHTSVQTGMDSKQSRVVIVSLNHYSFTCFRLSEYFCANGTTIDQNRDGLNLDEFIHFDFLYGNRVTYHIASVVYKACRSVNFFT